MAKLSDIQKVKLLKTTVLNGDIEKVKEVLEQQKTIEIPAEVVGLACRSVGADMAAALLDRSAWR